MKVLGKTSVTLKPFNGEVEIRLWERGDPFPKLGPSVGIDTETELITETVKDPPMVVYGCFDPTHRVCWIVYWNEALEFMQFVSRAETRQIYFNIGFDELVIDNEDEDLTLMDAIEAGRARDMQIRYHLYLLATWGDIPEHGFSSLKDVSRRKLGIELDKGEKDDPESHRLTFRRYKEDGSIWRMSDKQAEYLAWDCISTWALSQVIPEQPTEVAHTKGMCVLAHIMRNGIQVDPFVFSAMERELLLCKEEARDKLMSFGFPDPEKRNDDVTPQKELFKNSLAEFCRLSEQEDMSDRAKVSKDRLRFLLAYAYDLRASASFQDIETLAGVVTYALDGNTDDKMLTPTKSILQVYKDKVLEPYDLLAFDSNKNKIVPPAFMGAFLEDMCRQWRDKNTLYRGGFCFQDAIEHASDYMDDHPWLMENKSKRKGPKVFFQEHVAKLLEKYPTLQLNESEKTHQKKLAKDDMWRLEDLGIEDDFLKAYTEYYHMRKLLSTYLNRSFINSDGRIRAHFQNLKRTSRTSCRAPNLQNLPSREKRFPLKNVFAPYPGTILCATDYSFIELVSFAQTCYSRFGFSTMRDIINAGIDPHRWFAGVMTKLITTDLKGKDDPKWVEELNKFLKENVPDEQRQLAKCANFGLPGRMGPARFYIHLRSNGLKATPEDAEHMCQAWVEAFPEMKLHRNPERATDTGNLYKEMFGRRTDEDYEEEEDEEEYEDTGRDDSFGFRAVLPCGQVRNRCSINAACNAQFQATTAIGVKLAGWDLVKAGYGERLVNMIHDEYLYCLYPEEIQLHVPIIEKIMVAGMHKIIPDVKVKVETTCMLHWDKKAAEFNTLQWNPDGTPILEEPPYVQNLLTHKE